MAIVASWVIRCGGKNLQFSSRQLQISDRGDTAVQNWNFALKFPQNRGLPVPNFVFLEENSVTRRNFSNKVQFTKQVPFFSLP